MMPQAPMPGAAATNPSSSKDLELFNVKNHMNNLQVVYFSRVYASIVAGVFSGIIGVTGFVGILHFIVWQLLFTGLLVLKAGGMSSDKRYFRRTTELVLDQAFTGTTLLTFILFWTFAYSIVHVF